MTHSNNPSLISRQAAIYGSPRIGAGVRVEPFAIVNRPRESDVAQLLDYTSSLEDLYDRASSTLEIGPGTLVRSGCVLYSGSILGGNCEIGHHAVVRESVHVGDFTRIWPHTSIRRDAFIGKGCRIGGVIGDRSVIEDYVTCLGVLTHDFGVGVGGVQETAPTVRDGAVVGRGAVVVGGVRVGSFAVVGAGAVVRRDVAEGEVVAGNPARVVALRSEAEIARVRSRMERGQEL